MRSGSEWLEVFAKMECPFIQSSIEEIDLGVSENSSEILERAINVLGLHEDEIRRHKQ